MFDTLTDIKPRDVPLVVALRNTAAIVLPLAMGIATDHVDTGLGIATGALNSMFLDQPGPYRLRMQRMALGTLAAGLSSIVGGLIGANIALMIPAALLWGIGGGVMVALGPNAGRAGLNSMVLLIVMGATQHGAASAFAAGLLVVAGGLLQMLFALAAWPLQRYGPERHALTQVCQELAAILHAPLAPDRRDHAPPVSASLIDAERLLNGAHRARGTAVERLRVLARAIERARLELLALGDALEALPDGEARRTLLRLREYAARAFDGLGAALARGTTSERADAALEGFDAAQSALEPLIARSNDAAQRATLVIAMTRAQALGGQLRAAARNASFASSAGELREAQAQARLPAALRPGSPFAILRANLHLQSTAFRHALRCGACLALAVAGEHALHIAHGVWIAMTTAIVLKPDYAGTFRSGLLRVAGTLAGLVLTSAIVHYAFGSLWAQLGCIAVLAFGFRVLATMNYGLAVTLLTGLIVILLALHGNPPGAAMLERGIATAIGSALALAAYALWPTRERPRPALATMLDAYREYFSTLFGGDTQARDATRTAARSARSNAQASIDRLRGEPGRNPRLIALTESVFANANRFVRAAMSLEAIMQDLPGPLPAAARVHVFAARIDAALATIADGLRHGHAVRIEGLRSEERALNRQLLALPEGAAHDAALAVAEVCDRITDAINTLAGLIVESAARQPAAPCPAPGALSLD